MPRKPRKSKEADNGRPIEDYEHKDKTRLNNPPVGLARKEEEQGPPKKKYEYDPHLDPQLVWSGKAEHTSFEVPTVSLHVHERIEPRTIIDAVRKQAEQGPAQGSLFSSPEENPPLRNAIEFYKHSHHWTNRLIAGDSLLVMNSLLEKEGMAGKVQMIYIDPPYGIKYNSNFQRRTNNRDVKDGVDGDLTQEPEQIKAFRDTWELGIHSYLSYLRDRLLLARELLTESGSVFVQISDMNVHLVKNILDEIFDRQNYIAIISFTKTSGQTKSNFVPTITDYIVYYAKNRNQLKYHQLFLQKKLGGDGSKEHKYIQLCDGRTRATTITDTELANPALLPPGSRIFATGPIVSAGGAGDGSRDIHIEWQGREYVLRCGQNRHWTVGVEGTKKLWNIERLLHKEGLRIFKRYFDDFPFTPNTNCWTDTRGETDMLYVVQTASKVLGVCRT